MITELAVVLSILQSANFEVDLAQAQLTAEVSSTLSPMGVPHTANALVEGGLLAVEAALARQPHQQPTALLVEGPGSFSCNVPHQPLGVTLLRWRMLLTCNWRVRVMTPCSLSQCLHG
jgi:hypothetical protein